METFTSEVMGELLSGSLKPASFTEGGWQDSKAGGGTVEGKYINWLTFKDNATSVVEDVSRIRQSPMVPASIPIYGYIYDCASGELLEVPEATEAGRAA